MSEERVEYLVTHQAKAGRASAAKRGHEGMVEMGQRGGAVVRQRMEDGRRWEDWQRRLREVWGQDCELEDYLECRAEEGAFAPD